MQSKSVSLADPKALSQFIAMFVPEAYEVEISENDVEIMTKMRLIEYANNILSANLGDESLPERFVKLGDAGGIENLEDAVAIAEWSGDNVSKLIIQT
nr:hypothetical protein BdHM001_36210 [Bdellovibrio sp. HM001]